MNKMVIETAVRESGTDPIFRVAGAAAERTKEIGKDAITNSTIGALMDDNGDLVAFKSVFNVFRDLDDAEISNYAGITGIPEFTTAIIDACFKSKRPKGHLRAIATPGGTGAIRNTMVNYTEMGDKILVADWFWNPYDTIAKENHRSIQNFKLFNDNGSFNMTSYKEEFLNLFNTQGRVLSILNSPAHNPTGYSISDDEWKTLVDFYTELALANPEKRIIILCDVAYVDFAGVGDSARNFMKILSEMPENILPLYAYSASKGFTMYGLRNGALICVAPTEEIAEEFEASGSFSNRGTWSNGTRGAMKALANIMSDAQLLETFEEEQKLYREILQKRAKLFVDNANAIGLNMCKYTDGFFISIPCEDPVGVSNLLMEKDFYIVALAKGLRFAPCAVTEEKSAAAPQIILDAINEFNNRG